VLERGLPLAGISHWRRKGGALQAAEKPRVIEVAATSRRHNFNHGNTQLAA
jgi:hypothetical protein